MDSQRKSWPKRTEWSEGNIRTHARTHARTPYHHVTFLNLYIDIYRPYYIDLLYLYKFKKVTWLFLFVCKVCVCVSYASFTSFGQLLRCAHKRINYQYNESVKYWLYWRRKLQSGNILSRPTLYETGLIAIREVSPLFCAGSLHGKSVQAPTRL